MPEKKIVSPDVYVWKPERKHGKYSYMDYCISDIVAIIMVPNPYMC
jgi:lipid A disaccharide synthetase